MTNTVRTNTIRTAGVILVAVEVDFLAYFYSHFWTLRVRGEVRAKVTRVLKPCCSTVQVQ